MSYAIELAAISRQPVTLAVVTLDYCSLTFGVLPCTGTGTPCYNTFRTCKSRANYAKSTKDYKFTSADVPVPFRSGERPYLVSANYHPTEIKTSLTVMARVDLKLLDEPDSDIGIDPYVATRASIQGTYFKKLLARNPNYKGRQIKIYEGFAGLAEGDFTQTWYGIIDNIKINGAEVTIEGIDILKKLSEIEVPVKRELKLLTDIDAVAVQLTLNSATAIGTHGFIRIDEEIIGYGTVSTVSHILSDCTRGEFGTEATIHTENRKVQECRYYPSGNPWSDHLLNMLKTDAGISTDNINEAAFTSASTWPMSEAANYAAIISEPMKLDELFYELVDLVDSRVWVAEDLKINISRVVGNRPNRAFTTWSDEANIIFKSGGVDLNEDSRITRAAIYFDKITTGDEEGPGGYNRLAVAIDANAESSKEYNDVLEKKTYCRWLPSSANASTLIDHTAKSLAARRIMNYRDALPLIEVSVERKDSDVKVGGYIHLNTDELLMVTGADSTGRYQVVSRDFGADKTKYKLQKVPRHRVCFIGSTTIAQGYTSASSAEQEYGFLSDSSGYMSNEEEGYRIY